MLFRRLQPLKRQYRENNGWFSRLLPLKKYLIYLQIITNNLPLKHSREQYVHDKSQAIIARSFSNKMGLISIETSKSDPSRVKASQYSALLAEFIMSLSYLVSLVKKQTPRESVNRLSASDLCVVLKKCHIRRQKSDSCPAVQFRRRVCFVLSHWPHSNAPLIPVDGVALHSEG